VSRCRTSATTRPAPRSPNPYPAGVGGFAPAGGLGSGTMAGTKFYTILQGATVGCFDFSSWTPGSPVPACSGFSGPASKAGYTVRTLENVPGCMAADGDSGQITVFNALTGSTCISASSNLTMAAPFYCDQKSHTGQWTTLTLNGVTGSEYATATVTISGIRRPSGRVHQPAIGAGADERGYISHSDVGEHGGPDGDR